MPQPNEVIDVLSTWAPPMMVVPDEERTQLADCGCGRTCLPENMLDARRLPPVVRAQLPGMAASGFICCHCRERISADGRLGRGAMWRILGAPPAWADEMAARLGGEWPGRVPGVRESGWEP